jgi:hypothetical protein
LSNAHYTAGRRLEYLARDVLVSWGYVVIRSAGSKGAADLVAIGAADVRLIQVKKSSADVSTGVKALRAVSVPAGVCREVWQRVRGGWRVVTV